MKRLSPESDAGRPKILPKVSDLVWEEPLRKAHLNGMPSGCVSCPDHSCLTSAVDGNSSGSTEGLCPANAIDLNPLSGTAQITNDCFGCGLCVLACPVGAIGIEEGQALVGKIEDRYLREVDPEDFDIWLDRLTIMGPDHESSLRAVNDVVARSAPLRGSAFYLLTEKVLRSIGIDARMSNMGDTSQRIDLVVSTPHGRVPVEIKSATETPIINAKSIQQAVENKLTISRMDGLEVLNQLSTWVIGYEYPPDRTQHLNLVEDIYRVYGISVGLLSIRTLFEYSFLERWGHVSVNVEGLYHLKGIPCDV